MAVQSLATLQHCAEDHLRLYTDPTSRYAFRTYDNLWGRTGYVLNPLDLLASRLPNMPIGWEQVIPLFAVGDTAETRLLSPMQRVLDDEDARHAARHRSV